MLQMIPWSTYTYRSRVDSLQLSIESLRIRLLQTKDELKFAKEELEKAEQEGRADDNLPDDYGKPEGELFKINSQIRGREVGIAEKWDAYNKKYKLGRYAPTPDNESAFK